MTRLATMIAISIGAKLRHARIRRGLTAREVGDILGLPSCIVSRTERGLHLQELPALARHAEAVGLAWGAVARSLDDVAGAAGSDAATVSARARPPGDRMARTEAERRRAREVVRVSRAVARMEQSVHVALAGWEP